MMDSNTDLDHLGNINYKLVGKHAQLKSKILENIG